MESRLPYLWYEGGKTIIENGQMLCKEESLSKRESKRLNKLIYNLRILYCLECHKHIDARVYQYSLEYYGYPLCRSDQRKIDRHTNNGTSRETINLYYALKKNCFSPILEKFDGHKHIDIAFERPKLYIEIDGKHHHHNASQALKDLKRNIYSKQDGYHTIHIPNIAIHEKFEEVLNQISKFVLENY